MSEKCISTSPSAIQVENRQTAVSIEEKLDAISILENVNELLTYGIMLYLLIIVYVQFVILLIDLWKVWFQNKNVCVESVPQSHQKAPYLKL